MNEETKKTMTNALENAGVSKETIDKVLKEAEAHRKDEAEKMPQLPDSAIEEIIDSVRESLKSKTCSILISAHENNNEEMENVTIGVKGKKISIFAMLTVLVYKTLKKLDVPAKELFDGLKFIEEKDKKESEN